MRAMIWWMFALGVAPVLAQASNDELVQMILEFAADDDADIRGVAFEQVRMEAKGTEATAAFAAALESLPPASQAGMIAALAERGDTAAKPKIKEMLSSPVDDVAAAAIRGLGKLGDASDVPSLVALLKSTNAPQKSAAQTALTQLKGDGVGAAILEQLQGAAQEQQLALIQLLATRRAMETIPELLELAQGRNPALRREAMTALGKIASPSHLPGMVQAVLKAEKGSERNAAEKCVMFVCRRIENPDERALLLLEAMERLNAKQRVAMIQTLGRVGGKPAWTEVKKAIDSRDAATHLAGIRGISNWPDASVADELMRIAKADVHSDHQRIARMSLLRIAPLPDGREDLAKLKLLQASMKLAANAKEKNYGIRRAAAIRLVETLRYILPFIDQSEFREEACRTVVELAHDRALRDSNKAEFHAALDKVIAKANDPQVKDRANRYKKGQTWVRPK